ncbi:putative F420-dependent oxidoreductase [Nocardia tenerifensis]|uniref:Putative F420-dependent oxidoreductase n=1 Tax=Nocardia tenerifensis TaxID=228006 RepID=A0A318K059_9NOCA|nr:LLM class F420-dependent oxidoreductase [Nocardia tenerifensis]PXX61012.1 putative F420-dependent oxidoreductase [Nocardia tenerifensis]
MQIGINTFVTDEGISGPQLGPALEERGFDSLLLAEHSHIPASRETPYPGGGDLPRVYYRVEDPFVTLAAVASVTRTLLLGTAVTLLIQRDVIHTAKQAATLDRISNGRFLFGVGAGWNREEMANHGTDPRTRGALLDEQVAAIREIWTEDLAEYHGQYVDFDPIYSWPKPVQRPHPPIFVGGGPAAVQRAIRHGVGWFPLAVPDAAAVPAQLAELDGHDLPVTVVGAAPDLALLDAYAEAGVQRVSLTLPTLPESETLDKLDEYAKITDRYLSAR